MKVDKIKVGATIPVVQYGNIQPEIELSDVEVKDGLDYAMKHISSLWNQYSEKGNLTPKEISYSIKKKSFNEDVEIDYDDINHIYVFNGKELTSATGIVKKYYKDFDSISVAKQCAKSWGVDESVILSMWDSNRDLASSLGSVIHKALEHYHMFKAYGQTISDKRGVDENYALPKHPLLRDIILSFEEINKEVGLIVPEALITNVENGYCGHADVILIKDIDKKICRIQDYKINVDSESESSKDKALKPFDILPQNKITKYQIQLSVYANMLQKSGWTVEGLDVFVYEDSWKHFPLEVLNII